MNLAELQPGDLVAVKSYYHYGTNVGRVEKVSAASVVVAQYGYSGWETPARRARHNVIAKFPDGTDPATARQALIDLRERFWDRRRELDAQFNAERTALFQGVGK